MSRRRKWQWWRHKMTDDNMIHVDLLSPLDAARRERVRRHVLRVKRRAARRWPT